MGFIVNLNKPPHISSHKAVSVIKNILKARKAGHAGTLDPMATGVLLVCVDEATKISRYLTGLDKSYRATIRLGQKTDTYDSEGRIIDTKDASRVRHSDISSILHNFIGDIQQVPPMYSALKSKGKPLYKLARKGRVVELQPRNIKIFDIKILQFINPSLILDITCSKGTYIRSLAHDIGTQLGVGAHLSGLVRMRVGDFDIRDSVGLVPEELHHKRISLNQALRGMKEIVVRERAELMLKNGMAVEFSPNAVVNFETVVDAEKSSFFRLKDQAGELFALAKISDNRVMVERMFLTKPKEVF